MKQKEWENKEVQKYVIPDHNCYWWYRLFDGCVSVRLRAFIDHYGPTSHSRHYHVQLSVTGDCDCTLYLDLKTKSRPQAESTYNLWKEWIFDIIDDGISAEWCFERGFHLGE